MCGTSDRNFKCFDKASKERHFDLHILVISSLTSIKADQISEMHSLGFHAVELNEHTTTESIHSPLQFVYINAEHATERKLLEALKDHRGLLHQRVLLIVGMNIYVLCARNNLTV